VKSGENNRIKWCSVTKNAAPFVYQRFCVCRETHYNKDADVFWVKQKAPPLGGV
jgi:hypothetical protein